MMRTNTEYQNTCNGLKSRGKNCGWFQNHPPDNSHFINLLFKNCL